MAKEKKKTIIIPERIRVSHWEVQQLMAKMLNVEEKFENDEIDSSDLEEIFYEKFKIGEEDFQNIVEHLMPYSCLSESELTGTIRAGFVDHVDGIYIVKEEIK